MESSKYESCDPRFQGTEQGDKTEGLDLDWVGWVVTSVEVVQENRVALCGRESVAGQLGIQKS